MILLGDTRGSDLLLDQIRRRSPVEDPLALLADASQATAAELPDDAQVCNCNGVSKRQIADAIQNLGCNSVSRVGACTRAGQGC